MIKCYLYLDVLFDVQFMQIEKVLIIFVVYGAACEWIITPKYPRIISIDVFHLVFCAFSQ